MQFKTIPETNELDGLARDLKFHPCQAEAPRVLSREQVESFNRNGFISPIRLFDEAEIVEHRHYFDRLLEQVRAAGGDSYSISTAHLKYGAVYDLLAHPRIVAIVRDLLGENVIGWGSHYFCKLPGDGKCVSWHQDASYWPLTPSKAVTVWLAIDDADKENACMRFLPGSHLHGHLTWHLSETDESNVLNQTVADVDKFGQPFNSVLNAGEASLHSDLLLHGSEAHGGCAGASGLE
jgi:non-heme Fe2+,alpha-ketoglutarate-dependent halogenase